MNFNVGQQVKTYLVPGIRNSHNPKITGKIISISGLTPIYEIYIDKNVGRVLRFAGELEPLLDPFELWR